MIAIPTDQPHLQCLGPLGNLDPTDLINAETNRIPLEPRNFLKIYGKTPSVPGPVLPRDGRIGSRVSNSNEVQWGERKLD